MTAGTPNATPAEVHGSPCLVVDAAVLSMNIASTHVYLSDLGVAVRPHVKTHKSLEIARLQLAAGADGLTVATVGEAKVFRALCTDLFIAYPLWPDPRQIADLNMLAALPGTRLAVGADSPEGAAHLACGLDPRVEVMVEVDGGHHRTGAEPGSAWRVAEAARDQGLPVRGVFTYPGHSYAPDQSVAAARDEADALRTAGDGLREHGFADLVLSGGSTPSARSTDHSVVTETRPGVYVFNDAQQWELGVVSPDHIALTAHGRIVSRGDRRLVLDAGAKVLGSDRAPHSTGHGRLLDYPDARIVQLSEHHAVVEVPETFPLGLGDIVRVVPNHVCNAVNLVDELVPTLDGRCLTPWRVGARGLNR